VQDIIKENWSEIGVLAVMTNEEIQLFLTAEARATRRSGSSAPTWRCSSTVRVPPNPVDYLRQWTTAEIPTAARDWPTTGNFARMHSTQYDDVWAELAVTGISDPSHEDLLKQLQDLQIESGAIIPLVRPAKVSATSNSIGGFGEATDWDSEFWNIEDWFRIE